MFHKLVSHLSLNKSICHWMMRLAPLNIHVYVHNRWLPFSGPGGRSARLHFKEKHLSDNFVRRRRYRNCQRPIELPVTKPQVCFQFKINFKSPIAQYASCFVSVYGQRQINALVSEKRSLDDILWSDNLSLYKAPQENSHNCPQIVLPGSQGRAMLSLQLDND